MGGHISSRGEISLGYVNEHQKVKTPEMDDGTAERKDPRQPR